jgi:hypothetical protein
MTLFPVITGQTGLNAIFQGARDFDLELVDHRTLDGHIQETHGYPDLRCAATDAQLYDVTVPIASLGDVIPHLPTHPRLTRRKAAATHRASSTRTIQNETNVRAIRRQRPAV